MSPEATDGERGAGDADGKRGAGDADGKRGPGDADDKRGVGDADEGGGAPGDGLADPATAGEASAEDADHRRGRTVTTRAPGDDVVHPAAAEREFGWRGLVLLVVMLLALVVAPVVVALRPPALPWYVTLVVFPLLPAMVLGIVAVWATTRP